MLKEFVKIGIPFYGDMKIHRLFSRDREKIRQRIEELKKHKDGFDEREQKFKQELADLVEKYGVEEQGGNLVSLPSFYKSRENVVLDDLLVRGSIMPEVVMYLAKYVCYGTLGYGILVTLSKIK